MIQLDETRLRDALSDILDTAPAVPEAPLDVDLPTRRRWHPDLVAAAAVVGIGVAGVVVIANRDDDRSTTQTSPTTAATESFHIPADGRLIFDPIPDGLRVASASRDQWESPPEAQVYVENRVQPELGAAVFVRASEGGDLPRRDDASEVIVQSTPGIAFAELGGEHVGFGPIDGVTYYLDGYGMSRADLLAIAEGATFGEHRTASIDPAFLPPGMTSFTAGSYNESDQFSPATLGLESVIASWLSDEQGRVAGYSVTPEYGHLFSVNRLAHTTVRDLEVGGLDGYIRIDDYPSGERSIVVTLTDRERTLSVFVAGFTEAEAITLAATLRPATDEEWAAMLLATDDQSGDIGPPPSHTEVSVPG